MLLSTFSASAPRNDAIARCVEFLWHLLETPLFFPGPTFARAVRRLLTTLFFKFLKPIKCSLISAGEFPLIVNVPQANKVQSN